MSFEEFAKRADEADRRLKRLQEMFDAQQKGGSAAPASGGANPELDAFKAEFLRKLKEMRVVAAKEAEEMAALKKENAALQAQNTQLEHKVGHLVNLLKQNNIEVPADAAPSKKDAKAAKKAAKDAKKEGKKKDKGGKKGGEQQMSKAEKKKAAAEEEAKKKEAKKLKAAIKEGGKKGQDLMGMNETGGTMFFHVTIENSFGRWDLLQATMDGFNKEVDPEAEDRKGGAAGVAKCLFSLTEQYDKLLVYIHVPAKAAAIENGISKKEWADAMMPCMGPGAKIIEDKGDFLKIEGPRDEDANLYPLKFRDAAIGLGYDLLVSRKLAADADSDDDVDYGAQAEAAGVSWGAGDY